jgi:hypothetical protein
MSELEHCRLAYEGKFDELKLKIETNPYEDLTIKKDQVKFIINSNISRRKNIEFRFQLNNRVSVVAKKPVKI